MGFLDKLLGRGKQAAADLTGDASLKHEGVHQEQAGVAEERAESHEDAAAKARQEAAGHKADEHQDHSH